MLLSEADGLKNEMRWSLELELLNDVPEEP